MNRRSLLLAPLFVALLTTVGDAQHQKNARSQEQSVFGVEQESMPVQRPIEIPEGVLEVLRGNEYVLECLRYLQQEDKLLNQVPASWFVGSEIHLDGPNEIDLVVLPRVIPKTLAPCLLGANVGRFWVFRQTPHGYELALEVSALGVEVLKSRSKGYRDILVFSATAVTLTSLTFKFDGHKYRLHKKESRPIG